MPETYTTTDGYTFRCPFKPPPVFCGQLGVPIGTWVALVVAPDETEYLTTPPAEVLAAFNIREH